MAITYIAEIGNNHGGSIDLAKRMIDAAMDAGATYVKFQVYNIEKFISKESQHYSEFQSETLSFDDFRELKRYVDSRGGQFLATPFDDDSVALLQELGVSAVKISSGDVNNWLLLERVVRLKKPLFVSLGGASLQEINHVVDFLTKREATFSLLHCIMSYPSPFESINLNFISFLRKRYSCPIGFSDHSLGIEAALGAIALGSVIIEKHFTIDRALPGGDNSMSVLPEEFKRLVREGNNIYLSLGSEEKILSTAEASLKPIVRRVFCTKHDMEPGMVLSDDNLVALRGYASDIGLSFDDYAHVVGKICRRKIRAGEVLSWDMFQ